MVGVRVLAGLRQSNHLPGLQFHNLLFDCGRGKCIQAAHGIGCIGSAIVDEHENSKGSTVAESMPCFFAKGCDETERFAQ